MKSLLGQKTLTQWGPQRSDELIIELTSSMSSQAKDLPPDSSQSSFSGVLDTPLAKKNKKAHKRRTTKEEYLKRNHLD